MHIVLPGALPDPEVATELAPHLTQHAPTLADWFLHGTAEVTQSLPAQTWCTPLEHWMLQVRGFTPAQSEHISAGLGPLRAQTQGDEPVWLAELIHMAPSRDGAALLTGDTLEITPEQSETLLASAQEIAREDGIDLEPVTPDTWRVHWPILNELPCASPALVAVSSVNDWWPQASVARPWRRLVNSLQMAWYEHPVNLARQAAGLAPLNSLWLYGGARPSQLTQAAPADLHIEAGLLPFAVKQDWGSWIQALAEIERRCLVPLGGTPPTVVLTGRERYATLDVARHWWARLKTHDWRQWWCSR